MSSDSSSSLSNSSSNSGRATKLTRGGKVPARHFMDDLDFAEGTHPGRRATMKIVAAVAVSAVVVAILATMATITLYHKEEVKDFVKQRMADVEDLWANTDLTENKNYFADIFMWKRNKKYVVEVTPNTESNNYIMDLFRGKKIKKFDVKITGI